MDVISSFHGLHQLLNEATHLLETSASCMDLIFTNQRSLVIDSGVHPSLHTNCHHQIVHYKLNLYIKFPPPCEYLVWDYNKADTEKIKKTIEQVHWENIIIKIPINKQKFSTKPLLIYSQTLHQID